MILLNACIKISQNLVTRLEADVFTVLEGGQYPACAVSIGGTHLLLVRHFGPSFTISLPLEHSFSFRATEDFDAKMPEIRGGFTDYCAKFPKTVSMADVVIRLKPAVAKMDNAWCVNIPGTPIPSEMWLTSAKYQIGLFQEGASVRVVVWVGSEMRSFGITSPERFGDIGVWIIPQLVEQAAQQEKILAEEKKDLALPLPTLAEAMAVLRRGARLQLGVGRWYQTYFLEGRKLCREVFDEGDYAVEDATEEELADSMKNFPAQARAQLPESLRGYGQ